MDTGLKYKMNSNNIKYCFVLLLLFFFSEELLAQNEKNDSTTSCYIHQIGMEFRPSYIFPTNIFLAGENEKWTPIKKSFSAHLRYAFQSQTGSCQDRIYGGAYQGLGAAFFTFSNEKEIGEPFSLYLLQGARIAKPLPQLSLNYEWNFGLSFDWHPYDMVTNYYNLVIGSKINAYINANFYLNWEVSNEFDLRAGYSITHFSNGNTNIPNAGLNTNGLKIGFAYNINRNRHALSNSSYQSVIPKFPKHFSYDLTLFGSWRKKGVPFGDRLVLSPHTYSVLGFNLASMYNFDYRFRAGVSLDGTYDGSANVYTEDFIVGTEQAFFNPPIQYQLALGLSGRLEYVMPYFTIGVGIGKNILHKGEDFKAWYQILSLKIAVSRNSFLHVGYSLHDLKEPNFLMLGIGYRFNNQYPKLK